MKETKHHLPVVLCLFLGTNILNIKIQWGVFHSAKTNTSSPPKGKVSWREAPYNNLICSSLWRGSLLSFAPLSSGLPVQNWLWRFRNIVHPWKEKKALAIKGLCMVGSGIGRILTHVKTKHFNFKHRTRIVSMAFCPLSENRSVSGSQRSSRRARRGQFPAIASTSWSTWILVDIRSAVPMTRILPIRFQGWGWLELIWRKKKNCRPGVFQEWKNWWPQLIRNVRHAREAKTTQLRSILADEFV